MKKKMAAQHLISIDGCMSSWSNMLNTEERMKQVKFANGIAKACSDIKQDRLVKKQQKNEKNQKEEQEKAKKRAEDTEKAEER